MARISTDAGAHFYRADFQVHTPRDGNWSGTRATTPEERKEYAAQFVAACRAKALQAVAITDHHDFVLFPYIRKAVEGEIDAAGQPIDPVDRLVVFPGLELTLAVPCQAILILDADFPEDKLVSVLEALSIEPVDATLPSLPSVVRLEHVQTLEALHRILDLKPWLVSKYIVLPNVTDKGYQTLMRSGMQAKYKNMPCVGGYLDGTVAAKAKPGSGNRNKFDGLDAAWGNKRLALFQTSDSRSLDFSELGKNTTWVKWATPSAEALRQACLAQESRVAQTQPALPSVYIANVHVSNSQFLGPVDLELNPQYNAIIGGRGTGKSTILDYIRWCLGDTPVAGTEGDELPTAARQRRLIETTLGAVEAQIEVTVVINGITHIVRRYAKTGELHLKVGDDQFDRVSESAIQSLLPIHAYSQKQLSSVSIRLDELTRFVTAPIRQDLDAKDSQITGVANRLRQNYASLQRARSIAKSIERNMLAERSLVDQAAHVRTSLAGLSPEDQQTLDQRPAIDRSREATSRWERTIGQVGDEAHGFLGRLDSIDTQLTAAPQDAPGEFGERLQALRDGASQDVTDLRTSVAGALDRYKASELRAGGTADMADGLRKSFAQLDGLYEKVKERSTAHKEQLDQLALIEQRRTTLTNGLTGQRAELESLGDPTTTHNALRAELIQLTTDRSELLAKQCEVVSALSKGLLDARIARGQGFADVQSRFKALSAGSSVRASKLEALFDGLTKESGPLDTWETVLTELELLLLIDEGTELTSEGTPTLSRLGLTLSDQQKLRSRMTVDSWLDLALTPIKDQPVFRYQTKEKTYIPFESASAGQQATALLGVLLSQTGTPLIIDQPEEDLDSQVVQDVVTWLWEAKSKRQIVFASHNANLVVNGDAELVTICDYRRTGDQSGGKIKLKGAIDMPEIRTEITHVMEGGEKAFKLRKDKYGF